MFYKSMQSEVNNDAALPPNIPQIIITHVFLYMCMCVLYLNNDKIKVNKVRTKQIEIALAGVGRGNREEFMYRK